MSLDTRAAVTVDPKAAKQIRATKSTNSDKVVGGVSHVVLALWSLVVILPMLWTLLGSFKTTKEIFKSPFGLPANWNFDNYVNAWVKNNFGPMFLNTVIVVGSALILVMLLGAMCAYVLARFSVPGSRVIYYLMLAGLTFPVFLAIVPLFFVLQGMGLLNTLPGLIITYVAFALPFTVFFLFSFFKSLPYEIQEAAYVDGASEWRTFFQVMLPMAKPGLAAVAIMNFLGLWNQFLLPISLNTNQDNYVLSQGMAAFASSAGYQVDFGAMFAAVIITIVPVLLVYILFQRQLQGSVSQGTSK
ncbi:carbohydrate ABC transporter permease [Microbacterium azadirachtae]|uniref:Trehalose transport system permease protein SugB n=1 Tax=Microbacterium azadirachtae TaxID=582680 RepID=A0A0F0LAX7_9MICO|nr:carbohydrate ABC transporter permease [Microbacterium azadirachtae]KJL29460.1 Trehalose transport system permease protein SugB [Microbacterium azadirachtae]UXW84756.1 carbohydrate ABC transporter permease [Microbacterium azadirachtae]SDM47849.1 carbohydrate ABC transporter membrane protein 2, CUT1 family [Microbacterium azadirachtae]SEG60041.1 carbohydrate ABC transporter membrane protein 2, CUT1 family [Microbacterium azadirachtae]SEG61774.1 carbohydrate ABC transporter membrane protein 2,